MYGLFVLVAETLRETRRTADAAVASNETNKEIGRDQSRAYLHVDQALIFWGDKNAGNPRIQVVIKNTGATPAKWFELSGLVVLCLSEDRHESIADAGYSIDAKFSRWSAIGGGQKLTASLRDDTGDSASNLREALGSQTSYPLCIGQLRYCTFFDEIFISEFVFFVRNPRGWKAEVLSVVKRRTTTADFGSDAYPEFGNITETTYKEVPLKMSRSTIKVRSYLKADIRAVPG